MNHGMKDIKILDIGLWVWGVSAISAIVIALLIIFVFAPTTTGNNSVTNVQKADNITSYIEALKEFDTTIRFDDKDYYPTFYDEDDTYVYIKVWQSFSDSPSIVQITKSEPYYMQYWYDDSDSTEVVAEAVTESSQEYIGGGPHAPDMMISLVDELMVRTGPGTEYEAFAKLSKGEEFGSLESVNGWAHGYYNGREAWVSEQYLVSWPSGTGNYADFEKAIEQFDPMHLSGAVGPYSIECRGLDNIYVYFQAYAGGGWECVKVTQASQPNPYTVEYMSESERAIYENSPYPQN